MSERPDSGVTWHIGGDFVTLREGLLNPHLPKDIPGHDFPANQITILDDKFAQIVAVWFLRRFGGFDPSLYKSLFTNKEGST